MRNLHYIDKTECLEKGIVVFPSIYIMGAAATGKSTVVEMFLGKRPQVKSCTIDMEKEADVEVLQQLAEAFGFMEKRQFCVVLENVPARSAIYPQIAEYILNMPENGRVILIGRNRLPEEMMPLLWKRKLEIVHQEMLAFSNEEVRKLSKFWESPLNADEVWKKTGGWAGCVDTMLRVSANLGVRQNNVTSEITPEDLRKSYEINTYIEKYIVDSLSTRERRMFDLALACPWINESLCKEMLVFSNEDSDEAVEMLLESMTHKGFLHFNRKTGRWKIAPLFEERALESNYAENAWNFRRLGEWYEEREYLKEALRCYEKTGEPEVYNTFVKKYYNLIPFGYRFFMQGKWDGDSAESIYLRGMQCYMKHDFHGLDREIHILSELYMEDSFLKKELLLNLYYTKPDISLEDWLTMLEQETKEVEKSGRKFRLYNVLGNSCTYLCGIRDLTGLFSCSRKEENRRAKIWRNAFGEREWTRYQLAKIDYYLETERQDAIREEELEVLRSHNVNPLARLYLIGKMHRIFKDEDYSEQFQRECVEVLRTDDIDEARIAEAYISIHSPWINEPERLTRWLKNSENEVKSEINEQNYCVLWFMAKGYLLLGQYKKAEKLLKRLIPYIKMYRRQKFLAEALFQQAIISWETGSHTQALTHAIESFYIGGNARYVRFYVSYGKRGKEVLEAYEEWYQKTEPEGWSRKKKYQYGNVLRMPLADYLDVIMRGVRREARSGQLFQEQQEDVINEHLTMMETIILQDIGRGLTNNEICIEQNLKMPTVKSHIYSLYKKLGVNSRVQATLKGKEMGILE